MIMDVSKEVFGRHNIPFGNHHQHHHHVLVHHRHSTTRNDHTADEVNLHQRLYRKDNTNLFPMDSIESSPWRANIIFYMFLILFLFHGRDWIFMKGCFHGWFVSVAGRFELGRWFVCYSCSSKRSFCGVVVDYSLSPVWRWSLRGYVCGLYFFLCLNNINYNHWFVVVAVASVRMLL
jgi:hypothetical protein